MAAVFESSKLFCPKHCYYYTWPGTSSAPTFLLPLSLHPKIPLAFASQFDRSGVQLIEREEEVCIFYEKINIQEKMKLNAEIEIHVLDEKIRFLKLKIAEKQRQIHVTQKLLPAKKSLDAELAVLQIQVGKCSLHLSRDHLLILFPSIIGL